MQVVVVGEQHGVRVGGAGGALMKGGAPGSLRFRALWGTRPRGWAVVGGFTYSCASTAVMVALPAENNGCESGSGKVSVVRKAGLSTPIHVPVV